MLYTHHPGVSVKAVVLASSPGAFALFAVAGVVVLLVGVWFRVVVFVGYVFVVVVVIVAGVIVCGEERSERSHPLPGLGSGRAVRGGGLGGHEEEGGADGGNLGDPADAAAAGGHDERFVGRRC